jgi:hypothetical protein
MHIIFGDAVQEIPNSYTVLELDTFNLVNENKTVTAYCVVEKIPLAEFSVAAANKELHANLVKYYREQQWNFCEQAITALMGKWNGELDSFYSNLQLRIDKLKSTRVDKSWQGFVDRY